MRVAVLIPGALRADTEGAAELAVDLADGADLAGLLAAIGERWPRLARRLSDERGAIRRYVNIYVDSEDCRGLDGTQTALRDGTRVEVIPSVAGG